MGQEQSGDAGGGQYESYTPNKPQNFSDVTFEFPITKDQVIGMMRDFSRSKVLRPELVTEIIQRAQAIMAEQGSVIDVECPKGGHLTVVGDIHGQYIDMLRIFRMGGWPSALNVYVFDGDFVDRGPQGAEVVLTLLAWKLVCPGSLYMLRGNHEVPSVNEYYGFRDELQFKYRQEGDRIRDAFNDLFTQLPLGAIIANRILVVHGGIPRALNDEGFTLDQMRKCGREAEPELKKLLSDVLWSDPHDDLGTAESERNAGILFGPDVTQKFLQRTGLECIIRAHQVCADGYRVQHHGRVITIFSAPNYCGRCDNSAAVCKFDEAYRMRIFQFREASRGSGTSPDPNNAVQMSSVIGRYHALTLGTDVENFHGHAERGATAVCWSPGGDLLVSGGDDGSVRIWGTNGVERAALTLPSPESNAGEGENRGMTVVHQVKAVAWVSDLHTIAAGASDGRVYLWDVAAALANTEALEEVKDLIASKTKAFDEFAHDLLDQCNVASQGPKEEARKAQLVLDDLFVAKKVEFDKEKSDLEDRKNEIEAKAKQPPTVVILPGHYKAEAGDRCVLSLAYDEASGKLASSSRDGTVLLVDARSAKDSEAGEPVTLAMPAGAAGGAVAVNCVEWYKGDVGASTLLTASDDGSVRFWLESGGEAPGGPALMQEEGPRRGFTAASWCSGGELVATGGHDGVVRVWRRGTGKVLFSSGNLRNCSHSEAVLGLAWLSPDRLVSASVDKTLRVWNVGPGVIGEGQLLDQYLAILMVLDKPEFNTEEFKDEKANYSRSIADMTLEINPKILNGLERQVTQVCVSPDGQTISAASLDRNSPVSLWEIGDLGRLDGHGAY